MNDDLPLSAVKFAEAAKALGLAITIKVMRQSTRTAEQAAQACGCSLGQIVKSLVFRRQPSGEAVLLLVSGAHRVNETAVGCRLGARLERADADFVRTATGYAIGGIPPLGHTTYLATYMDEAFLAYDVVWAAAGTPTTVFAMAPTTLQAAANARLIKVE